jgi:hypothetical protein
MATEKTIKEESDKRLLAEKQLLALEAERKQLLIEKELFHLLQQQLKVSPADKQMQALQAAVKTMRKVDR